MLRAMDGDGTRSLAMRIFFLLEHLYTEHPPLNPEGKRDLGEKLAKLGQDKYEKVAQKKCMLAASRCYHPDKNKDGGPKQLVLCEEIQKHINARMTDHKGPSAD
jgi:hypothetical protein